ARTTIRCSRLEPVARETDNLLLQEGMWRSVEVVVEPAPPEALAAAIDAPLVATADWTLYDAVYGTGAPLEVTTPALRSMVETYRSTIARLPLLGDDWGSLGGLERYNHCGYIWEDYFRTADPRLRQVALDYSENYHDYSVNWGPNPDHYGGGRYPANARTQPWPGSFRTRQNDAVTFCTKGYRAFWLTYEETGDPRFRHAAEQQARWSAQHVHATVNYTRCIGQVTDFVKLYEYTGERSYLAQAERLWTEFQACQDPDLLFNERGVPSTGNDLYIADDSFGYEHPYVKSYIVQYATNALPDLLAHRPDDQRLRDTIIALNDWMARVQTAAGGWSYPGPTTAGFYWSTEYAHGLMKGFQIEPKPAYLTAVGRELRALATLLERYGALTGGVVPWETLAGLSSADLARRYRLGSDRDRTRDFTDGRLTFGYSPDSTVYLQVLLRDYLQQRPEATLFEGDAVLDQIHALPTTVAKPERQEGDPSLRITVGMTAQPKGLLVMLDAGCLYRLSGAQPSWRWHLPDGTTQEGPKAGWVARRAGDYVIKLSARVGDREYTRSVSFTAPPGPGDLGRETWPAGQRVQAESLVAQGGGEVAVQVRTASEKRGAEGGSLSHWNATGAWVEWEVELPRAGRYFMLARYACPIDASRRVSVDGREAGTLALPATGGYGSASQDDWRMVLLAEAGRPLAMDLPAGRCRLRLTNADGQGLNLDYLELVLAEPKQE
ncbi:MAG: hypothetical protein HUU35_02510, partial [Armatimonadetes bacterium]|nr:hypothetical protein [Armatimonadota bacterium]